MFATQPARSLQMSIYQRANDVVMKSLTGAFEETPEEKGESEDKSPVDEAQEQLDKDKQDLSDATGGDGGDDGDGGEAGPLVKTRQQDVAERLEALNKASAQIQQAQATVDNDVKMLEDKTGENVKRKLDKEFAIEAGEEKLAIEGPQASVSDQVAQGEVEGVVDTPGGPPDTDATTAGPTDANPAASAEQAPPDTDLEARIEDLLSPGGPLSVEEVQAALARQMKAPPAPPPRRGIAQTQEDMDQDEMREFFTDAAPQIQQDLDAANLGRDIDAALEPIETQLENNQRRLQEDIEMNRQALERIETKSELLTPTTRSLRSRVGQAMKRKKKEPKGGRSATIAMNKLKKGLVPKARPNKLIKQLLAMVGGPHEMELLGGMKGRERLGTLRKKYKGENPEIRLLLS